MERYCVGLVEAAAPAAAAVKPQVAFFEALGGYGLTALERVCAAATELGVPVIADAKRGDIPSTAAAYAAAWLEPRPGGEPPVADALTVNPYLGGDSLDPFAEACDRAGGGIYVLVRTSNPGSADLQALDDAGRRRLGGVRAARRRPRRRAGSARRACRRSAPSSASRSPRRCGARGR